MASRQGQLRDSHEMLLADPHLRAPPSMSLIREDEITSLGILGMIIHVVGSEGFDPQIYPVAEHQEFFLSRIQSTNCDPVYRFNDGSSTQQTVEQRAAGSITFEHAGESLARAFSSYHVESSSDGAFFVFELGGDDDAVRIYCLIKYDYREVLEQSDEGGEVSLRRIVQAFVTDKRAIQKSAVIRVEDGTASLSVAAMDRVRPGSDIGDYFRRFLDVAKERSDTDLTEDAKKAVKEALSQCTELLPDGGLPVAFRIAREHLRGLAHINEDGIRAAVFAGAGTPEREDVAQQLYRAADRRIRVNKLAGLEFQPSRSVLGRAPRRLIKTREAVEIRYTDGSQNVRRTTTAAGGEEILITTRKVEEDRLL